MPLTPYFADESIELYHCDFREGLSALGRKFDACIADPPYGETSLEWDRWPKGWPAYVRDYIEPSGTLWCFGSFRMFMDQRDELLEGWQLVQEIIWHKQNGSSFHADRFKRVHELAAQFRHAGSKWKNVYKSPVFTQDATKRTVRRKTRPPHTGHIEASSYTSQDGGPRLMRSVIEVASCHGYAQNETQKPLGIIRPLIEYACPPGGTLLVPFAGAGSELVAAKEMGRRAVGFEVREDQCVAAAGRLRQGFLPFSQAA